MLSKMVDSKGPSIVTVALDSFFVAVSEGGGGVGSIFTMQNLHV